MRRAIVVLPFVLLACSDSSPPVTESGAGSGDALQPDVASGEGRADTRGSTRTLPDASGGTGGGVADLGQPCAENADCLTGLCVDGPTGPVCTQFCTTECPEDYVCKGVLNGASDVSFVCIQVGGRLCEPCTTDIQCNGGFCVSLDGGGICTVGCVEDAGCPAGLVCRVLPAFGEDVGVASCVPPTLTCTCTAALAGLQRTCSASNELGTCTGVQTCDPATGWTSCTAKTPTEEVCNGLDDDCDALVDEGLPASQPCENAVPGVGTCTGVAACGGASGWVCQATTPSTEVCDYVDNDCDGETDEGFKSGGIYAALEHCGACGKSCVGTVPNGTPSCVIGSGGVAACGVAACNPGFFPSGGIQCLPDLQQLCQPCANAAQCYYPGAACIALEDGSFCTKPCQGAGDCPSGFSCSPVDGAGNQCVPTTSSCTCDGSNLQLQRECQKSTGGTGEPVITCIGAQACTAGGWGACVLPTEVCDGQDNDCNGVVDDGFRQPGTGKYVTDAHCGQCNNSCLALSFPQGQGTCDSALAVPSCVMACDAGWVDVNANPNDGCECHVLGSTDHPYDGDANCDGVDGEVSNAIFVSKEGDDQAAGTRDAPVFTVQRGIDRAKTTGRRDVYVATGVYVEAVKLAQGVAVYGGYSADFAQHEPLVYETAILGLAPTAALPGAVNAIGIAGSAAATRFDGFTVFAADGAAPGQSTYGIYVRDSGQGLAITRNTVFAGDGARGSDGAAGGHGAEGPPGKPGSAAHDIGTATCTSAHHTAGATSPTMKCGVTDVSGGKGGNAVCPDYDESGAQPRSDPIEQTSLSQESGSAGKGNTGGTGAGGAAGLDGGIFTSTSNCGICHIPPNNKDTVGQNGAHGKTGTSGAAGAKCTSAAGTVQAGLWVANDGGSGAAGGHGGGGGGGGAGGGVETESCSSGVMKYDDIGGSGGSGGGGACGGTSGTGGKGGGGSFGIFVVFTGTPSSMPGIADNVITRGSGGAGGTGGQGGVGGAGGSGGEGGASGAAAGWITFCAPNGGTGGDGGDGGHGGGGAGGCGGVSYGLYVAGQGGAGIAGYKAQNSVLSGGAAGSAGLGGDSAGKPGPPGTTGAASDFNF